MELSEPTDVLFEEIVRSLYRLRASQPYKCDCAILKLFNEIFLCNEILSTTNRASTQASSIIKMKLFVIA